LRKLTDGFDPGDALAAIRPHPTSTTARGEIVTGLL